jgi:hypothetical protein
VYFGQGEGPKGVFLVVEGSVSPVLYLAQPLFQFPFLTPDSRQK